MYSYVFKKGVRKVRARQTTSSTTGTTGSQSGRRRSLRGGGGGERRHTHTLTATAAIMNQELPVLHVPHDAMREGVPAAVSALIAPKPPLVEAPRLTTRQLYGIGAALQLEQDAKLMENYHRFPGIASSFIGLQTVNGQLSDLAAPDWMEPRNAANCDFHATMERALKM